LLLDLQEEVGVEKLARLASIGSFVLILIAAVFALSVCFFGFRLLPGMGGKGFYHSLWEQHMSPYGGYGMMGPGLMERRYFKLRQNAECRKYYNDTVDLRREMNNKRFEYFEAIRNPKTSPENMKVLDNEVNDLRNKLYEKIPRGCW
jgi:hypothetical protein